MRSTLKTFSRMMLVVGVLLFAGIVVVAQSVTPKPLPKQISGGILNGKAVSLPKPEYPAAARAEKAAGKVGVQVLIDEEGNVISAKAASGPENAALRSAAESAALQAKFSPTLLSGTPVKVSGVITYDFVASSDDLDDGMNAFMAATILFLVKDLSTDPETFARSLEVRELELRSLLKDAASDPDFPWLAPLAKLEATPAAKRVELVESVLESMAGKLSAEHSVWKFELGRTFGDVLAGVMLAALEPQPDASKFDQVRIKRGLKAMKQMLATAPGDLPKDVLSKLHALAEFADRDDLVSEEGWTSFFAKLESVLSAISPD